MEQNNCGVRTPYVMKAKKYLEQKGYEVIIFLLVNIMDRKKIRHYFSH